MNNSLLKVCLILALVLVSIYFTILQLRQKHPAVVHAIFYFISLAGCTTVLIGIWSSATGAMDQHGNPHNQAGEAVMQSLKWALDLNADILIVAGIISLLIVPQITGYLLSAIFGCSSEMKFIESGINFAVLSVAKSFATAAGVLAGLTIYGAAMGWDSFGMAKSLSWLGLGGILALMSFVVIWMHYEAGEMMGFLIGYVPGARRLVTRFHELATRHRPIEPVNITDVVAALHRAISELERRRHPNE